MLLFFQMNVLQTAMKKTETMSFCSWSISDKAYVHTAQNVFLKTNNFYYFWTIK